MAGLIVKEITELNDIEFTDESLILGYTDTDGVGKTTFAKAKENIGSDIKLEQTKIASASGGDNEITATLRNGKDIETKTFIIKNGNGLNSITESESTDENGLRSNNVTFNSNDTTLIPNLSIEIKDGVGIKSVTQTTSSFVSSGENIFTLQMTDGTSNDIKVYNGRAGKDLRIKKTYESISAMNDDFNGTDVETFEFAMIDTGSVEDADTGKLYCKGTDTWSYIGDLSGKQGIKGETGNGIKSASTTYQLSTSGTEIPTDNWSSTPLAPTETLYLWTKTVLTFTDGTTHTSYSVGGKSVKGDKGDKGDKGATGPAGVWNGLIPTSEPSNLVNGMIWMG